MGRAMGSHHRASMISDVWLTPPEIVMALGPFDLDPCAPAERPWDTAAAHYTPADDGLSKPWFGRVWLNPPYSREAVKWLQLMRLHGNGVALIFARTETSWFFENVWRAPTASAALFLEGRIYFHYQDGRRAPANAGAPSVLVSYGQHNAERLAGCGLPGHFVRLANGQADG